MFHYPIMLPFFSFIASVQGETAPLTQNMDLGENQQKK